MKQDVGVTAHLKAREFAFLQEALPALTDQLEAEMKKIAREAGQLVTDNALTGDQAVLLWVRYHAADQLLRRFEGKMKVAHIQLTQADNQTRV